jgi:hypothetical protein
MYVGPIYVYVYVCMYVSMKVKHSTFATLNPIIINPLKTKKDRENEREEKVGVGNMIHYI